MDLEPSEVAEQGRRVTFDSQVQKNIPRLLLENIPCGKGRPQKVQLGGQEAFGMRGHGWAQDGFSGGDRDQVIMNWTYSRMVRGSPGWLPGSWPEQLGDLWGYFLRRGCLGSRR